MLLHPPRRSAGSLFYRLRDNEHGRRFEAGPEFIRKGQAASRKFSSIFNDNLRKLLEDVDCIDFYPDSIYSVVLGIHHLVSEHVDGSRTWFGSCFQPYWSQGAQFVGGVYPEKWSICPCLIMI